MIDKCEVQKKACRELFTVGQEVLVTNLVLKKNRFNVAKVLGVYHNHIVFAYKCFLPHGESRGVQCVSISLQSLICGSERVVFL